MKPAGPPTATQRTSAPSDSASVRPPENAEDNNRSLREGIPDWEEEARCCIRALSTPSLRNLAAELRVSEGSLRRLEVGFDAHAYTFPMRDSLGNVIGIRFRDCSDLRSRYAATNSKAGLFIPQNVLPLTAEIVVEGETDTAAALTLGVEAVGVAGAHAAVEDTVLFFHRCPTACPCIVADNDLAGQAGAQKRAEALVAAGIPCRVLIVPDPHGDLRDWVRAGLTKEQLMQRVHEQPIRWPADFVQGYARLPNYFPRRRLVAAVGPEAFALLMVLATYRGADGQIRPDRAELADAMGRSTSTIDRWKGKLRKEGLLWWRRGRTGRADEYFLRLGEPRINGRKGRTGQRKN